MPKFILRFFALSVLSAAGAFGQVGSFGQLAYGGSWQTTFTLINLNTSVATVTLSFFDDNGSALTAPVQNFGFTSAYTFAIPAGGTQDIVLSSTDRTTTQGWASLSTTGNIRGQASFRFLLPSGTLSEAVVPLSAPGTQGCIVPFPQTDPVILLPFDNTGQYVTSLAFVNISAIARAFVLEFDDQSGNILVTDTLSLSPKQHTAFVSVRNYQELAGKKGILRIHASAANLTVLGLLTNSTGAITTIIPVTQ
jgi:hypothetical protein